MSESSLENNNSVSPQLTELADLLGKKSVRVTFKLHPAAIELLSLLASQLGIKQKSLFDYQMEDVIVQSLVSVISACANAYTEIEKRVEQGKRLSEFSIDALKRDQDNQ